MSTPKEPLSQDYPKWLRKAGVRDILVQSEKEEGEKRAEGFSHEVIVSQQAPPLGSIQPTPPPASAAPTTGVVPTSVLDSMLESQRERFDASWANKCAELSKVKVDLATLQASYDALKANHDAATDQLTVLNGKPEVPAADTASPVKPPIAAKKG